MIGCSPCAQLKELESELSGQDRATPGSRNEPEPAALPARSRREAASTLQAVQDVAQGLSAIQQRGQASEKQGLAVAEQALNDLRAAQQREKAAHAAIQSAEQRIKEAEARAQEADEWFTRLEDAMTEHFVRSRHKLAAQTRAA